MNLPGADGLTPLHHSIENGHTSTTETILAEGADINSQTRDGSTCLHLAIKLCEERGRQVEMSPALEEVH